MSASTLRSLDVLERRERSNSAWKIRLLVVIDMVQLQNRYLLQIWLCKKADGEVLKEVLQCGTNITSSAARSSSASRTARYRQVVWCWIVLPLSRCAIPWPESGRRHMLRFCSSPSMTRAWYFRECVFYNVRIQLREGPKQSRVASNIPACSRKHVIKSLAATLSAPKCLDGIQIQIVSQCALNPREDGLHTSSFSFSEE